MHPALTPQAQQQPRAQPQARSLQADRFDVAANAEQMKATIGRDQQAARCGRHRQPRHALLEARRHGQRQSQYCRSAVAQQKQLQCEGGLPHQEAAPQPPYQR